MLKDWVEDFGSRIIVGMDIHCLQLVNLTLVSLEMGSFDTDSSY